MSRTYRRKTAQPPRWIRQNIHDLTMWYFDGAWTMSNAPHWYCNTFERKCRQANRAELWKYANLDYEPMNWCRHRSSATYCWW